MSVSGGCIISNKSNIWLQISSHFSFLWMVITSWCWCAARTPGQLFRTFYHSSQVPPYIGPVPSAGWSLTGVRRRVNIHHYLIWTIKQAAHKAYTLLTLSVLCSKLVHTKSRPLFTATTYYSPLYMTNYIWAFKWLNILWRCLTSC